MKKLIILIVFVCFTFFKSYSQDFPDFGSPSKEEIELKECSFDKAAPAVVLIHEAFSYSEDNLQLITTHHVRIKILNQSGFNAANVSIPFFRINNFERIINLEALTINVLNDGKITKQKVTKKSIYTTKVNDLIGEINFAFPSVKTGSIVEYQYQSIMKNYWGLGDWYFQQGIPVMVSRYHLKMISNKRFNYQVIKRPDLEVTVLPETDKIFFEMRNIPGLSNESEPYMDAKNDNFQRVNIWIGEYNSRWGSDQVATFYPSWPLLNTLLLYKDGFGSQIVAPIAGTDSILSIAKSQSSEIEKMKLIYDSVRNHMTWNNVYRKFCPDGVNDTWKKGSGSSGDINMVLINLLNKAQLKTYPLLVSQRFNGKVDTSYAYAGQFNSVFACVEIKGQKYILDATDKFTPPNMFPETILNTTAFLIDRISGELLTITPDSIRYKREINLDIQVTGDGFMKGNALINNDGYAKIKANREYKKDSAKFRGIYLQQEDISLEINKFEILNAENDLLPLVEKFEFSTTLNGSGNYKFIPLHLFTGFDKNPFINDSRFSNINFGYNRTITLNAVIKVPENYTIDGLPANPMLDISDKDIILSSQVDLNKTENTVYYNLKIEFNKNFYESAQYPAIKEKYKRLFNLLSEKIVLRIK